MHFIMSKAEIHICKPYLLPIIKTCSISKGYIFYFKKQCSVAAALLTPTELVLLNLPRKK